MEYKLIKNESDINELMNKFNFFHDSCIKEMKYLSGSYVDKSGAMYPFDDKKSLIIMFQSQSVLNRNIEIKFDGLVSLNLLPRNENYDSIIFEGSLIYKNDLYYWSEWRNFDFNEDNNSIGTWLSARNVSWRFIPNTFLGEEDFFKETI